MQDLNLIPFCKGSGTVWIKRVWGKETILGYIKDHKGYIKEKCKLKNGQK